MSISNPKVFWTGESGDLEYQKGLAPKRSRTVVWVCGSTSTNAIDVAWDFQNDGTTPFLGDALSGDPSSLLKKISASRAGGTTDSWYVSLNYTPRDEGKTDEKEDDEGNKTSDPLKWHDEIAVSFSRMSVPVYSATYRGGFVGAAANLIAPGHVGCPVNSAFVPFNPGLEKDIACRTIRISKWRAEVDGERLNDIQNRVNNDTVTISKPLYKFKDKWKPFTARIMNAGGSFQLVNEIKVWRVDYEIMIRQDGWREQVVDRGIAVRAMPGVDPDGEGGTIPAPPQSDDQGNPIPPPKGQTQHRNQMDNQFVPITEPVLFDGDGQPLAPGKPTVYITYSIYPEGPYAGIDL